MSAAAQRYTAVAIVLHWAIAFATLLMIPLGFWMHGRAEAGDISAQVFSAFQLHKSVGLTVLALSVVRLGWRLANPPPPMPARMPAWERIAAKAPHGAVYALMVGLPLSGWLYVSTGWSAPLDEPLTLTTSYFGLFNVPALFGLGSADQAARASAAEAAFTAHWLLAYAMIALAVLHVAAALKHQVFDRDEVLAHMVPGLRAPFEEAKPPRNPLRLAILGGGLGLTAVALAAFVLATPLFQPSAPAQDAADPTIPTAESLITDIPAGAPRWIVDTAASSLSFRFVYTDQDAGETTFTGRFARWDAAIYFEPDGPGAIAVVIETASAADGVAIHDRTLPNPEWFDVATHPVATFIAEEIRDRGEGAYEARGQLTIKGESRGIDLPFTLRIEGDRAVMEAQTEIDRRDFGVGAASGPAALISRNVELSIHVEADRAP